MSLLGGLPTGGSQSQSRWISVSLQRQGLGLPPGGSQFPSRGILVSLQGGGGSWLNQRGFLFPPRGVSVSLQQGSWSPSRGSQSPSRGRILVSIQGGAGSWSPSKGSQSPVNKMTHASENITFQQLCSRVVINLVESCEDEHLRKTHHIHQTRSSQMVSQEIISMSNHSRVFNVFPSVIFQICGQGLPFEVGAFLNFSP